MSSPVTRLARQLARRIADQRRHLVDSPAGPSQASTAANGGWRVWKGAFAGALHRELEDDELLGLCLETEVCARLTARGLGITPRQRRWLSAGAHPCCRPFLAEGIGDPGGNGETTGRAAPWKAAGERLDGWLQSQAALLSCPTGWLSLYEHYLGHSDGAMRKARGVYYTPRSVARSIIRQVDRALEQEFGLPDGLADTCCWGEFAERWDCAVPADVDPRAPFVTLLDPALGTGVFLLEAVDRIHQRLAARWRHEGASDSELVERWNAYVPRHLLPRLFGLELMLPALVVALLQLAAKLAETGFDFRRPCPLHLLPANTLADPREPETADADAPPDARRATAPPADLVRHHQVFTVLVGNPPFAGISQNGGSWIRRLLHGHDGSVPRADYLRSNGRPLGERKHWLHDDYVKFLRYAHWQIERRGTGILGMVTNHGYLDNKTFRGMREQLLQTFPRGTVVDLHGNRKKREVAPDGSADENVFGIDQGVAIAVLRRPPRGASPRWTSHDLRGERDAKLRRLETLSGSDQLGRLLQPTAPVHLLTVPPKPLHRAMDRAYRLGIPLNEAMPVSTTAPVTARDGLVVAMSRRELVDRLERFCDLSIPDEVIRNDYFPRRRSWRYPAGDTRGWKLAEARRRLADTPDWQDAIRTCLYRPFDERYVCWLDGMIDWPRGRVARHLLERGNRALIARRQMLPGQPCTYFWICEQLALDGVIRSDNRGSESLFPLYLHESGARRPNLSASLVGTLTQRCGLEWTPEGRGDLRRTFGPEDVFAYAHALFHSAGYRERYAELLRRDFPRLLLPAGRETFAELAAAGHQLAHLQLSAQHRGAGGEGVECADQDDSPPPCTIVGEGDGRVDRRRIDFREGAVWINERQRFTPVAAEAWQFRVGGHQVCHKWLADRAGRRLTTTDCWHYARIAQALEAMCAAMCEIDRRIESLGGWRAAFARCERRGD